MLGNNFLLGSFANGYTLAIDVEGHMLWLTANLPFVRHRCDGLRLVVAALKAMTHRHRHIVFLIKRARHPSDRCARNQLLHEHDAAPPAVFGFAAHIKPQVYFFKVAMERDGNAEESR